MELEINKMHTLLDNEHIRIDAENGILIGTYKDSFINLDIAKKIVSYKLAITAGKKYPLLAKIKSIRDSTKEARDFLASEIGCTDVTAVAIHVDSVLEKMLASFFIYLNKPLVPSKIFNDETKAKEWLAEFVTEV